MKYVFMDSDVLLNLPLKKFSFSKNESPLEHVLI